MDEFSQKKHRQLMSYLLFDGASDDPFMAFLNGIIFKRIGRTEQAEAAFTSCIYKEPFFWDAW